MVHTRINNIAKLGSIIIVIISLYLPFNLAYGRNERIIDGSIATHSQYPYQASIRTNGIHKCGGVIISRNYIITAARCVIRNLSNNVLTTYDPEDFNVRLGSTSLYNGGILVDVSDIVVHASYNNMLNDVALLKVKESLIYSDAIKAISLPSGGPVDKSTVIVLGWGFLKAMGDISRYLQWIEMQVVDPVHCFSNIFGEDSAKSLLCLESPVNSGICNGDIGGSAVQNNVLLGLASFAISHCGSEYPDGFTNIAYYVDWIKANSDLE